MRDDDLAAVGLPGTCSLLVLKPFLVPPSLTAPSLPGGLVSIGKMGGHSP
jgi:hypothetical protein